MKRTSGQRTHDTSDGRWAVGLEDVLGVPPAPAALFIEALTHPSYANERPGGRPPDNQRLEFLGDAVVGLAVARSLWQRFPDRPEGELARARTALVNTDTLAGLGRTLQLGPKLFMGKGEEKSGGRGRNSTLCDAFEALVGALFVAYGWETAAAFVVRQLERPLQQLMATADPGMDAKTRLQERLHEQAPDSPVYVVTDRSGPDHERVFTVDVLWKDRPLGTGRGRSKRAAEQAAASAALLRLDGEAR